MNDIQRAREARALKEAHRMNGKSAHHVVLWEDIVREADGDCTSCGGAGLVGESLCACAESNFQRRRKHQTEVLRGVAYWLPGCPRG